MKPQPSHACRARSRAAVLLCCVFAGGAADAATITVNSAADTVANDGLCTLREAIGAANNNVASGGMAGECAAGQAKPIVDVIEFKIPGAGVHTISPASQLIIMEAVKIDGYTQPGSSVNTLPVGDNAVLLIEIAAGTVDGVIQLNGPFSGDSSGSTLRGLVVDQNRQRAIFVGNGFGNGSNNDTIAGNFIGVDPTGMTLTGNGGGINAESASGLVVGGASLADRNVIAAAGDQAILLNQTSSSVVQGNYIGINAAGTAPLATVEGILVIQGANNDTIGGTTAVQGNVIFGSFHAISVGTSDGTLIQGNFIGTDATGQTGFGPFIGIGLETAAGTVIGGSATGAGNVISGNQVGIQPGNSTTGTIIQGNKIGTDPTGNNPVPNRGSGIRLTGNVASGNSVIGGTDPGQGNTIAFNCGNSIEFNQAVTNWPILGNSIYASGGLGIALQPSTEPTTNDPGDADTGANNLQNYPVLTSGTIVGTSTVVAGTLSSAASTAFQIEVFSSPDCNRNGFGEGKTFLGSLSVTTDTSGNASFGQTFNGVPAGHAAVAATATDPDGNTSEFSMCIGGLGRIFADGFESSCGS